MSATTVTAAAVAFLQTIPGLTTLYEDMPPEMTGDNWETNSMPGTPGFIHLDSMRESRITVPAVNGGQKQVDYDMSLVMLYQYRIPSDLGASRGDAWSAGRLALVDAAIKQIRSDPAFGCGQAGPIFEAGNQADGISTQLGLPHWDVGGGKVMAFIRINFKVTEIVTA